MWQPLVTSSSIQDMLEIDVHSNVFTLARLQRRPGL